MGADPLEVGDLSGSHGGHVHLVSQLGGHPAVIGQALESAESAVAEDAQEVHHTLPISQVIGPRLRRRDRVLAHGRSLTAQHDSLSAPETGRPRLAHRSCPATKMPLDYASSRLRLGADVAQMAAVRSAAHRWPQDHAIKGTILSEESQAADRKTFSDLGVLPSIVDALAQSDIIHPFPIQAMAIPIALTGTDMIGQARTGTGKTLAFGITILQRIVIPGERDFAQLARPGAPQALVVTPTRELALQVSADIAAAAAKRPARIVTVYGGVGYDTQLDTLRDGVEVVVGTPGRLLDLGDRGMLDLSQIKVLVLDEADEMLDLGFLPDVERILSKTPELRQTMLFSATMPAAIVTLARRHLRHPVNIRAESPSDTTTVPTTAQFVYQAHDLDKPEVVARILQAENRHRVMIFCRTKRSAQRVADDLVERGFAATSIHGDLSQVLREKALRRFRDGRADVL